MTNTTLTWVGIVSQAIPAITAILMVTVGNCMIKRKELIKNIKLGDIVRVEHLINDIKWE